MNNNKSMEQEKIVIDLIKSLNLDYGELLLLDNFEVNDSLTLHSCYIINGEIEYNYQSKNEKFYWSGNNIPVIDNIYKNGNRFEILLSKIKERRVIHEN